MKFGKKEIIISLLCLLGILLIFILSWRTNPNLQGLPVIPSWLYLWTDDNDNDRIRTGVPFLILSILIGFYLCYKKVGKTYFFFAWFILSLIVSIAELGQHFIPSREFDFMDIYWGCIGSLAGLLISYFIFYFKKLLGY